VKHEDITQLSVDELWCLHVDIQRVLSAKMRAERQKLEGRLRQLSEHSKLQAKARRPYPKVHPKYRNPERPSETWSGRGKQPRWVRAELRSGKKFDDLLISRTH
jgi:DNA-binding protein H-NS